MLAHEFHKAAVDAEEGELLERGVREHGVAVIEHQAAGAKDALADRLGVDARPAGRTRRHLEAPQLEVTIELEGSAPTTPPRAPSPPAGPPSPPSGPATLDKNVGRGDVEEYPILLD